MDTQQRRDEQVGYRSKWRAGGTAAACREHKQEFQRLGYAGQKRGDRDRQQHTAHHRTMFFRRGEIHCERRPAESNIMIGRSRTGKHPRRAVASIEAVDIAVEYSACGIGEFANLEPAMVFSTRCRPVGISRRLMKPKIPEPQRLRKRSIHRPHGCHAVAARRNRKIRPAPDRKARCDRYKTFSTEETEKTGGYQTSDYKPRRRPDR